MSSMYCIPSPPLAYRRMGLYQNRHSGRDNFAAPGTFQPAEALSTAPRAYQIGRRSAQKLDASHRRRLSVGAHAVARDAAGGVGGAQARERLTTLRNLLARLTRGTRFWRRSARSRPVR